MMTANRRIAGNSLRPTPRPTGRAKFQIAVTVCERCVALRRPHTALVTDQKTAQTHIWLTWPRAPANDAERAASTVFSEYIQPILFQEVREARGLAYTVFGGSAPGLKKADDAQLFAYVGT
jgi:predicted Zn-dependent peptidase